MKDKNAIRYFEVIFDTLYIIIGLCIGIIIFNNIKDTTDTIICLATFTLIVGDCFHLLPRIAINITNNVKKFKDYASLGKIITSITMTIFYILLWHIALNIFNYNLFNSFTIVIYILALVRIILTLLPQNDWFKAKPSLKWGLYRNIPFIIMGLMVMLIFFLNKQSIVEFSGMWVAITLSFIFYIPVVLWVDRIPMLGMLMLPKTCMYIWMLVMMMIFVF